MIHHNHRESSYLPAYKAAFIYMPIRQRVIYVPIRHYICRESSTNQLLFMQNKPNVKYAQINVNPYMKSKYEKLDTWLSGKNKPNSNPIKPNLRKAKMNVNLTLTKDYRKKGDFLVRINKPNSRNGQNERKLNFNKGLQKKRCFRSPKNKPNSNPISKGQNEQKIACQKTWPHPHPPRFNCALYKKSIVWHYGTVNMKESVS